MKIPIRASAVRLLSSVRMRQASGTFMAGRFLSSVLVAVGNEFHRTVRILKSPGQPPVFVSNALAVDKTGFSPTATSSRSRSSAFASTSPGLFGNPVQRRCGEPRLRIMRPHPPMPQTKRESAVILKTDERKSSSRSGTAANSRRNQRPGTKTRVFLEGDKLEVAVVKGRWVLTHLPAGPLPEPHRSSTTFPTRSNTVTSLQRRCGGVL